MAGRDPGLRAVGIAALCVSFVLLVAVAAAFARASRPPLRSHGHRFVPGTGDWEGAADGYPISFELTYDPAFYPPYALSDVVEMLPGTCPAADSSDSARLLDTGINASITASGGFELERYGLDGGLSGARRTDLWSQVAYQGPAPGCITRLTFDAHPARRTHVQDGSWELTASDGERQLVHVVGGGRAVEIIIPSAIESCYPTDLVPPAGELDLFIDASGVGSAVWSEEGITATLDFAATSASGEITVESQTCNDTRFPITATLQKRGE
jgi:hypothetical protein